MVDQWTDRLIRLHFSIFVTSVSVFSLCLLCWENVCKAVDLLEIRKIAQVGIDIRLDSSTYFDILRVGTSLSLFRIFLQIDSGNFNFIISYY